MRTVFSLLLVAGALLIGVTPAQVGAARGPQPMGFIPHRGSPAALRANSTPRLSTPRCHGSSCTSYEDAINQYFADVAHDNGTTNNVYSVATQYSGIQYQETFGGSYVDTTAYPSNGCNDGYDTVCLSDSQLRSAIERDISANHWPDGGTTNLFFIFTPSNVGICTTTSECSTNMFCAYHDYISSPGIAYAVQPYNATIPTGGCDSGESPNGNDADATLNTVSHEQNEAITDADTQNGWYTSDDNENGDLCAWTFGATSGLPGAEYNQTINGRHYWLQQEYSNEADTAPLHRTGCVQNRGGLASANSTDPKTNLPFSGPLIDHGGSVMTTNTVYAIYWVPTAGATPSNTAPPVVSGVAAVGKTLSTSNGTWIGSPTSYAHQWQSCSSIGTSCADIAGATGTAYTLTAGDADHEIRSEVSATNGGGSSGYAASTPTEVVVPVPAITTAPAVSGRAAVGKTLSTTQGTWNTPVAYAYRWLRCSATGTSCSSIRHATSSTYTVVAADRGHELEARVTATNAAATRAALSNATATVVGIPASSRLPAIFGKTKVGKRLSVNTGHWSNSPSRFRYQWLRCGRGGGSCVRIKGATRPTYRLRRHDARHRLRVRVTAVNAAGNSRTTSAATRVVKR
ncbi:MAG: hypothetical protein ACRDLM_00965 [Gaiellaceae bacterium]